MAGHFPGEQGRGARDPGRFTEDLQALSRSIRWGEGDKLFELFSRTRDIRQGIVAAGQDSAEPNFGRDRAASDGAPKP